MGVFDDLPLTCMSCGVSAMAPVGEVRDELAAAEVASTGETVRRLVEQTAHLRCSACGHEATAKARF
jgi:hypothetical protein